MVHGRTARVNRLRSIEFGFIKRATSCKLRWIHTVVFSFSVPMMFSFWSHTWVALRMSIHQKVHLLKMHYHLQGSRLLTSLCQILYTKFKNPIMNFNGPFILFSYPIISSHLGVNFFLQALAFTWRPYIAAPTWTFQKPLLQFLQSKRLVWFVLGVIIGPSSTENPPYNTIYALATIVGLIFIHTNK